MEAKLELTCTAYAIGQIPELDLPQIAMSGRSNVGKSSLINALAGRKSLAKVSSNPGKTRSINFYLVRPYDFYLVDLPGYGYARASHADRREWAKILEHYLANSASLKALALLIDCRLPPQRLDLDLARFAQARLLDILPILTKADKCKQKERMARQAEWRNILGKNPILVSAQKRSGLEKAWREFIYAATGKKEPGEDQKKLS